MQYTEIVITICDAEGGRVSISKTIMTQGQLIQGLTDLGLTRGDTVMVHSSLKEIGYVIGGPATVIKAMIEVLGEEGTLIMPAFSPEISDPATWDNHSFNEDEIKVIRDNLPVFDHAITPTSMGAIPETFRNWPNVLRSVHPQVSVCALGPNAAYITDSHPLEYGEGKLSPFERIYELGAKILLLGVWTNRATMLHYAESLVPHGRRKARSFPIIQNGARVWTLNPEIGDDLDTHFPPIGEIFFNQLNKGRIGNIGTAKCCLASSKDLVDFGKKYLAEALSV